MNYQQLSEANEALGREIGVDDPLDEIMFLLEADPSSHPRYVETPRNSSIVASTCVDGVHFVALHIRGRPLEDSPVIEVAPLDWHWECVGESMMEAVELVCQGAEELEGESKQSREHGWSQEQHETALRVIGAIRRRFGLRPRPDREARVEELNAKYLAALDLEPDLLLALDPDHPVRVARALQ